MNCRSFLFYRSLYQRYLDPHPVPFSQDQKVKNVKTHLSFLSLLPQDAHEISWTDNWRRCRCSPCTHTKSIHFSLQHHRYRYSFWTYSNFNRVATTFQFIRGFGTDGRWILLLLGPLHLNFSLCDQLLLQLMLLLLLLLQIKKKQVGPSKCRGRGHLWHNQRNSFDPIFCKSTSTLQACQGKTLRVWFVDGVECRGCRSFGIICQTHGGEECEENRGGGHWCGINRSFSIEAIKSRLGPLKPPGQAPFLDYLLFWV